MLDNVPQTILSKIRIGDPSLCWEWTAALTTSGYGSVFYHGKVVRAHRVVYELVHSVALGVKDYVCHSCDNRKCVNPLHLWIGNHQENMDDYEQKFRQRGLCRNGHAFAECGFWITRNGFRNCKACNAEAVKRYNKKRGEHS